LLTPSDIAAIGAALNEGSNIFDGNQQRLVDELQTLNATEAELLNNPQGLSEPELENQLRIIDAAQANIISNLEAATGIDLDDVEAEIDRLEGRIGSYEDMLQDQAGIEQGLIDPEFIQNTIDSLTEELRLNTAISNAEISSALKDAAETMSTTNETSDSNAEISSALKDAAETMSTTNETPETEESNRDEISSNIETQNQQISDLMQPTLEQNRILSDIVSLLMADQNLNKRQLAALKSQQGNLYRGVG
jgi:chromosome segregation ATPase